MSTKTPFVPNGPVHWILDWDGTITQKDTLDTLVNISASNKPDFPTLDHWNRVSQAYLSDYMTELEKHAPGGVLPTTVEDEKRLLKALKPVEQRSLDRVSASGIFEGLTGELLDEGAKKAVMSQQVELRWGFVDFLRDVQTRITRQGDVLNLLSVNWSRRFIASSLEAANVCLDPKIIFANELEGIEASRSSNGHISPEGDMKIISSDDKLRYMERLRRTNSKSGKTIPIVYVGDSWTDIECLLAADLGICMRNEPVGSSQKKLTEALQRLGVRCPHIRDLGEADEWGVVWARDFTEIQKSAMMANS
ncbi:hypothetical protein P153DRAFT_280736 [Dothidotthia symphoricarpi CBS 119687]|uniref:HAD-like protein n=1 Tax=Dothidotthia symphoricarpi CBS 119687 TaxID=1392245 RepID=A0A6A6AQY1_9PLEO|nr:uncharacterized protein P153DRAFT_280736 [Dothidotthia symphoricarpi CBS 119687]KAF2134210.1 hypothetical protein P153DRAFT_280736 [Dothidotthia symphoricarpi CBS 119687]